MVAPDDLSFLGLIKRLVKATFKLLMAPQRKRVEVSLKEALALSNYQTTRIYNARDSVISVGVSVWAATLTVLSAVIRRTQRSAVRSPSAVMSPLHLALEIVDSLTSLVGSVFFFPRLEVDGVAAFRARTSALDLQRLAESFCCLVRAALLRDCMASFGF